MYNCNVIFTKTMCIQVIGKDLSIKYYILLRFTYEVYIRGLHVRFSCASQPRKGLFMDIFPIA